MVLFQFSADKYGLYCNANLVTEIMHLPFYCVSFVGYTARHLHQRIAEHKNSTIGKHFLTAHGDTSLLKEGQFCILKKCQRKFDCLIYEMLFIKLRIILVSTDRLMPFPQSSLFKNIPSSIVFLVFKHFYLPLFSLF